MKISFEEYGDDVIFRVYNYDKKYEEVLEMCFYQKDEDGYIKKFSKNIENLEKIKSNYKRYAEEMFSQLGYFRPIPWKEALLEFLKRIEGSGVDWWLTGSCAACLRGIKLNPHDIDIMVDSRDIDKVSEIFTDCIVEPIVDTNGWLTKDFGVIFLKARIDIASEPQECLDKPEPIDCGPYAKKNLEDLTWNSYKIKVPPVNLQLNANRRRGRVERVKLIEEYISKYQK
ncbi:hypothetical protein R9X47_04480 [Wukongibacter baidiensis]|uniref:nucleotidyltransferase domain-containing protein n=1 Tax=Wukongibacter baidiensis TaxID=1723361 RepID=UPI003D7FDD7F